MPDKTPLHHELVELGLGLVAEVTIVEIDPEPAPGRGSDWPAEIDWPRCQLTIALPARGGDQYSSAKVDDALCGPVKVLGQDVDSTWGEAPYGVAATARRRARDLRRPTIAESTHALLLAATGDLAQLRGHVARRIARLAQREQTLAAGRAPIAPTISEAESDRPLELDDHHAAAPERAPEEDDASQRYALLEIDPIAQPATTSPVRANRRRKAA